MVYDVVAVLITLTAQFEMRTGLSRTNDSRCIYDFYSDRFKTGRFFSPRYPQHYPPRATCQFFFLESPPVLLPRFAPHLPVLLPRTTCQFFFHVSRFTCQFLFHAALAILLPRTVCQFFFHVSRATCQFFFHAPATFQFFFHVSRATCQFFFLESPPVLLTRLTCQFFFHAPATCQFFFHVSRYTCQFFFHTSPASSSSTFHASSASSSFILHLPVLLPHTTCQFFFHALPHETVKVTFDIVELELTTGRSTITLNGDIIGALRISFWERV